MSQAATAANAFDGLPDGELAHRVARGDRGAIRYVVKRYNQVLFRTARAILRDDAEAEDAVQDAYVKAFDAIDTFRGEAKLGTWLVRIAANEALGRRRKVRRAAEVIPLAADIGVEEEMQAMPDEKSPSPEMEALRAEARRITESHIDALPDSFRAVFVLRAVEELTVEETAAALDIPEATVRTRFFRARGMLREAISRSMDVALGEAFHFAGDRCDRITEAVMARIPSPP